MVAFNGFWTKKTLVGLGLGQFLSLLITSTGFSSSELARRDCMEALYYIEGKLSSHDFSRIDSSSCRKRKRKQELEACLDDAKFYYYILLAIVDVEANFLDGESWSEESHVVSIILDPIPPPAVPIVAPIVPSPVPPPVISITSNTKFDVAKNREGNSMLGIQKGRKLPRYKRPFLINHCRLLLLMKVQVTLKPLILLPKFEPTDLDIPIVKRKLVVKAYQYTSVTSVMLLDCWSIPSVIFLTWFFLKTKYRFKKYIGVAICVAGLVVVVFSDVHSNNRSGGSNPLKGDMLVIAGSTLYAISNVSEDRSSVPILLKLISGSTMLNLSLLTSDMWTVLIRIFAYRQKVDWMYFIAFGTVAVGLVIYSGKKHCEIASALNLLDAALAISPRFELALELKARSLLYLRRFNHVADMLQDYIPRLKMASDDSSSLSSDNSSKDRVKLLSSNNSSSDSADYPSFKCFSVSDLKKKVMAGLCKNCDKEGQWRYLVLGEACCHLGLMDDDSFSFSTSDFPTVTAFCYLVAALGLRSLGDKEEDQNRAEVADEEAERSKHFDEEAGSGNPNQKTTAGCSKTGDSSSKSEFASTSSTAIKDTESRTLGKDTQGKKI
ncbi:unnamed protein product [Camellia sinensis]